MMKNENKKMSHYFWICSKIFNLIMEDITDADYMHTKRVCRL